MQLDAPAYILVVDSSPVHALQLQAFFEEQGWTVACAGNAEEAFVEFQRKRPDLLVAGEHLPGGQGNELCRQLQSGTSRIPAVIWSAQPETGLGQETGVYRWSRQTHTLFCRNSYP